MSTTFMKAKDTLFSGLAECYVTIEDIRYCFMHMKNVEAKAEKNKTEVKVLGKTGVGNKGSGWKGTGSGTCYFVTSVFRDLLKRYKNTGEDIYFDMQITNEDVTSGVGRQTAILYDCNLDGSVLAKFDVDGDVLDEDFDFTFEDFDFPETFDELDGFVTT